MDYQGAFPLFCQPLLGIDLKSGDFNRPKTTGWFVDQDFIARSSTASSVVVQGVKEGERPELTTMWTILGYPPTGSGNARLGERGGQGFAEVAGSR